MTIEIKRIEDYDTWNRHVDQSLQSILYHQGGFLKTVEQHTDAKLHLLAGYKGQEPVGVLPVFELSKGPIRTAFSPPPKLSIPYMGPAMLNYRKLKQGKREKRNRRFVDGCVDWIEETLNARYIRIVTTDKYQDVRPFSWSGFDVTPKYTYHVSLSNNVETIKDGFSSSFRRYLQSDSNQSIKINEGGDQSIEFIVSHLRERYQEQDKSLGIDSGYVKSLNKNLPSEYVRPYLGHLDDEPVGGIIALADENTIYFSYGGARPKADAPINENVHWQIIKDGVSSDYAYYDLVGANTPSICKYKSKLNPEMAMYFEIEKGDMVTSTVADIYKKFQ